MTRRDALCVDPVASTICGKTATIADGHGRTIQTIQYKNNDSSQPGVDEPSFGIATLFDFDPLGRLTGVTEHTPTLAAWSYVYDAFGNRLTSDDPDLGHWSMTYDADNNLRTQTDAKLQTITFTYDDIDRVLTKVVVSGSTSLKTAFTYDEARTGFYNAGQLTTQMVSLPKTTGSFVWLDTIASNYTQTGPIANQTRTVDGSTLTFTYTYAQDGVTLTSETLPMKPGEAATARVTGSIGTIGYDVAGRVTSYTKTTPLISSVTYDLWGQPDVTTYGSTAYDDQDTNSLRGWINQTRSVESGGTTTAFVKNTYTRLDSGRISNQTLKANYLGGAGPNPASFNYGYDYAGRLLTAASCTIS